MTELLMFGRLLRVAHTVAARVKGLDMGEEDVLMAV